MFSEQALKKTAFLTEYIIKVFFHLDPYFMLDFNIEIDGDGFVRGLDLYGWCTTTADEQKQDSTKGDKGSHNGISWWATGTDPGESGFQSVCLSRQSMFHYNEDFSAGKEHSARY